MIIEVTEKCLTLDEDEKEYYANRVYQYESSKTTLAEALIDCDGNFDSDNIVANTSNDEFPGECLSSIIVKAEIVEEETDEY